LRYLSNVEYQEFSFSVYKISETYTYGLSKVFCSTGTNVVSCGMVNNNPYKEELFRSAIPIGSRSNGCQCYDSNYGIKCIAWCTNARVNNFEIVRVNGSGVFSANCPAGKKVLGCHLDPVKLATADNWRYWYPSADGSKCNCKDDYGAGCVASCASYINNYEVVSAWGSNYVKVNCTRPNTQLLGCGTDPTGAIQKEKYRTVTPKGGSCVCYDSYGTRCYAVCGQV
jgi:hypothetical protein